VVVVLAFVLGWWLGGRRRPPAPKVTSQGNPSLSAVV